MVIDSKSGARGLLVNLDTGAVIRWARWANLETGDYEAFRFDPREAKARGVLLAQAIYRGRARLRWVPTVNLPSAPPAPVAAGPAPSQAPLRRGERCPVLEDRPCQHYGCGRLAEWKVADEEELPPERGPDGKLYESARTVGVRFYCSFHYQPPRLLAPDGEVVRVIGVKARPD